MSEIGLIVFDNVYKKYGKASEFAVENLNLEIRKGEIFALLGPNGAGKTTTLHMLIGALTPTKGNIFLYDKDIHKNIETKKLIGFVPAEPSFYPNEVTPNMLLELKRNLLGISLSESENFIQDKAKRYEAHKLLNRKISTLSTGERQKIGFIIAMFGDPELIVLDEAFSHIDPLTRKKIMEDLFQLQKKEKKTIIFSTHSLNDIENMGDRIGVINEGRLIISIQKEDLIKKYSPKVMNVTVKENEKFEQLLIKNNISYFKDGPIFHVKYESLEDVSRTLIRLAYKNNLTIYSMAPGQIPVEKLVMELFKRKGDYDAKRN